MLGAKCLGSGRCSFKVWGPGLDSLSVKIIHPCERIISLDSTEKGYWQTIAEDIKPGYLYKLRLNGSVDRPDPASNFQPKGVHDCSAVVDHGSFKWSDENWSGLSLEEMIIYELHIGTFTSEGTFEAVIERLNDFTELGINVIEIMPVVQFPGARNWGYDGVYPFAVQNSYGGPEGLKKLVNVCHRKDIAVILDVVYNHFGPEGNYLREFGPYFTDKYKTPWGEALNFDGEYSDEVRNYFVNNALFWFQNYHIDALRLDALHAIHDMSAKPFIKELSEKVEEFSRSNKQKFYLIGESDLNDVKIITPKEQGGYGLDAQWCDDFHHSLHTLLTGEQNGYYADFGLSDNLVKSIQEGFVYDWRFSKHRKRHHGSSSKNIPAGQFVVFSQNHDQIGNRMLGERLVSLVSFEALKLEAGVVLFSPYIPLLFMGQEYGEESPFLYFTSHNDQSLISAVRRGRKNEFKTFQWEGKVPDPQDKDTFLRSKIKWEKRASGKNKTLLEFYKNLINLRKGVPALSTLNKKNVKAYNVDDKKLIILQRWRHESSVIIFMNFENEDYTFSPDITGGKWEKLIDSSDEKWAGEGAKLPEIITNKKSITIPALSFAAYESTNIREK